ncbi:MAG TPA: sulfotransferase [Rhodanobacteraceae bacterium]|nr:sulfotransferase [Rhodanobacteraceae bacterium]
MTHARGEAAWLEQARTQTLRGQLAAAQATLDKALAEYPASSELRRTQAGILQRTRRDAEAEAILRELLAADAADAASAFALARLLQGQGRTAAAAATLRACLARDPHASDANLAIQAIELLDDCDRKRDAAAIALSAISGNPEDARLHAYAAMLQMQLGKFEQARAHYLFALQRDEHAWEWHMPIGLSAAQRYANGQHPDFELFRGGLQHKDLSGKARAELHFALGKAHDDIGDYEEAARHFREGNATVRRLTKWSRKAWRRTVEARLASKPIAHRLESSAEFTPIFIVGMPRSGTTLIAELLSRYPKVCNRGELPWVATLSERPGLSGSPGRAELQRAAETYAAQSRRDDAGDTHWFLDKQPLNFCYIDLILAMFPDAKIIHCQRNPRDTALSLWSQCFLKDVQGYSYDFDDISLVMRGCDKLMAHWNSRHPGSIRTLRYEELVSDPERVSGALAGWIGLPTRTDTPPAESRSSISTASLWQARQPINTRSIGRWRNYAPYVPELLHFPEQAH